MWIHPTLQGDVPIRYGEMLASLKAEWWDNGMSPAIAAAQEGGYAIRVHRLTDVPFRRTDARQAIAKEIASSKALAEPAGLARRGRGRDCLRTTAGR